MSLLTICQGAAAALSLPIPTAIVGNSEAHAVMFLQLAKQEGRQLMRRHDWQAIFTGANFTSIAQQQQSSAIPSDLDRFPPYTYLWDFTNNVRYTGPVNLVTWQNLVLGQIATASPGYWFIGEGLIQIYPTPEAGLTFVYNYISKNYCESSGGTDQADWAADADLGRVPEHLVELGLIWRWLRSKGMDYAEEMATYEREVEKAAARDRGPPQVMVVESMPRDYGNMYYGTITQV